MRSSLAAQLAVEARARSGFHLLPIGLLIGAAFVYGAGWRPSLWPVALLAALVLAAAWQSAHRPILRPILVLCGMALLGAAMASGEIARTETTLFSGEATVRISGPVIAREQDERGRYRYLIEIEKTRRPTLSRPPERARIVVGSRHDPIAIGGIYSGLVRIRPPSGPAFPGGYDFAFSPFFDGLGAYGFSLGAPDAEAVRPDGESLSLWLRVKRKLTATRTEMTRRIREAIGGPEGAIAAALITGERQGIPEDAKEWLRGTGLAHVLSISGLHMAIVAGFAMLLVRSLVSFIPSIALNAPTKKVAAVAALAIATLYLGLSGANVATQRAYVMLAIMLSAVVLDRPALTLRNVSIAALVVIALAPHVVVTASFQMSFAATVALIGGYAILTERTKRRQRADRGWGRKAVAALLAIAVTSLIAGSATGPYAAYHFHRMALFGFVANLLTMPLFTLWIMPLALIGSLLIPLGLEALPFHLMGFAIGIVLRIAEFVYTHLPDQTIGRTTATGIVLMSGAILAAACFASKLRWTAVPLLVAGLALAPNRDPTPSLLIFEDGKEIATLDPENQIAYRKKRPSDFIANQWERAYATNDTLQTDATGETPGRAQIPLDCVDSLCRFTTRDGLKVVWTDDYEDTGTACDMADVAIVARAIRLKSCRSGATLVTLRTLRKSGSLAIRRDPKTGQASVLRSTRARPWKWNRHRLAPWPEYWQKPKTTDEAADDGTLADIDEQTPVETAESPKSDLAPPLNSGESGRQGVPEP